MLTGNEIEELLKERLMEKDYKPTEKAHILPGKRQHWTWDDETARTHGREERRIQALAALQEVKELAAERGIAARELAALLCRLPAR